MSFSCKFAGRKREQAESSASLFHAFELGTLARMIVRPGREIPSSQDLPGQPIPSKCPQHPRGSSGLTAKFFRKLCFRRQLGPRRVFATPDPPPNHGANMPEGPRILLQIIQDPPPDASFCRPVSRRIPA